MCEDEAGLRASGFSPAVVANDGAGGRLRCVTREMDFLVNAAAVDNAATQRFGNFFEHVIICILTTC